MKTRKCMNRTCANQVPYPKRLCDRCRRRNRNRSRGGGGIPRGGAAAVLARLGGPGGAPVASADYFADQAERQAQRDAEAADVESMAQDDAHPVVSAQGGAAGRDGEDALLARPESPLALSRDGISRDGTSRDVPRLPTGQTTGWALALEL